MATGEIEVQVDELEILSRSTPLPFQLDEEGVDETLRIRYRWLDLRRERMQRNIRTRAQAVSIIRQEMEAAGFVDIETPIMGKPTPEGARDFLVPTRLQPGRFFALPQSPQIYKQLLVISGFERYYQIARCFRDEDLRADRLQELTQLDVEMAFPDQDDLFGADRAHRRADLDASAAASSSRRRSRGCRGRRRTGATAPTSPTCASGSRSRTRPRSRAARSSGCSPTPPRSGTCGSTAELSRGELAKLEEVAKEWGAKGLAYLVFGADGEVRSPIAKFLSAEVLEALRPAGHDGPLRRGRATPRSRASSASCACTSAASSG